MQMGSVMATQRINTDQTCTSFNVPGAISSYVDAGVTRAGVWDGTYTAAVGGVTHTVSVNQTTIVPVDKRYFVTRLIFCNTGSDTITDLYYARNVDPDNDQPWSGDFTTLNTIVSQPPADLEALVTASGLTYGCFLGLGTRDPDARVTYGNFGTGSPYQVWNGLGGYSLSGTNVADEAVSLAFRIYSFAPNTCVCKAFAYILDPADLEEALDATSSVILFADTLDITVIGETRYCVGDSTNLIIIGSDDYDWSWSPAEGLSSVTGSSVWASPTEPTLYTAVGTNGFCGDLTREVLVIPEAPGEPDAGMDLTICFGDTIQLAGVELEGEGPSTWWPDYNISDVNDLTALVWPEVTTEYVLRTPSDFGCPGYDTVLVTVLPLPAVAAIQDTVICFGDSVQLFGFGALTYQWLPVDFLDDAGFDNPLAFPEVTTEYVLMGTDLNGCVNYDTLTVRVNPLPMVNAGEDQTINLAKNEIAEFLGSAPGAVNWLWIPPTGLNDPAIPNPFAQPEETTLYVLEVTDFNGCINTDTLLLTVLDDYTVIIPDGFTPNGDGLNDVFHVVTIGRIQMLDVSIYDRWGELVFYSTERSSGWDGTYRGIPQEIATYVVVVRIQDPKGNPVKVAGTTTIIR